jgi:hypothetical protein
MEDYEIRSLQSLLGIVRVFYGKEMGRQWFEGFATLVAKRYGKNDPFSHFLVDALPFLKFVRNARNNVEHPKDGHRVVTRDYSPKPTAPSCHPASKSSGRPGSVRSPA